MSFLLADSSLWLRIAFVPLYVGVIFLVAELLHLYTDTDAEHVRKIVHIGTGNVILFAWLLHLPAWVGITASIVAAIVALVSYRLPILPGINSVDRKSFGTFFYPVSVGIVTAWFWSINAPYYGAIAILIMAWGDGLAAIIGQSFGKRIYTVLGNRKSWEGTLTMFVVSYTIVCLVLLGVQGNIWQTWVVGIPVAIGATAIELFAQWGLDNLTVPLGSGALVSLLNEFLLKI